MKVSGYSLPSVQHPSLPGIAIHPHQAQMVDAWNTRENLMLITKTGSGKTAATVLPFALNLNALNDNCAVFVYPTNELIRDQERSIYEWLAKKLNLKVRVITPANASAPSDDSVIEMVRIDAGLLEEYCQSWKFRTKGGNWDKPRALLRLLHTPKPKLVLINPDILYLIYGLKYGKAQTAISAFQAFQTIIFDEFHLYQGIELAHILYLIHAARKFDAFKRVILLSATPHPEVREWVDKLLAPKVITMEATSSYDVIGERQVAHDIEFATLAAAQGKEADAAYSQIFALLPELQSLRQKRAGDEGCVPCVVILNSVEKAIALEQRLLDNGFHSNQVVPVRGRSDRRIRKLTPEQLIVLGTSAIEVGIDFQCDYLIFEASDAASFMQRFGRLGRHAPGKAFLIGDDRECQAMGRLPDLISRTEFEEAVARVYLEADAKAWFVGTEYGAFAALTQAFNIHNRIFKDRDDGPDAKETKEAIYSFLDEMMNEYAAKMNIEKQVGKAKRKFWNFVRGLEGYKWVGDYLKIDSFRTGLPNATVYDRSEERRRGAEYARYDVDISVILQKARNPQPTTKEIYVDDLTDWHTIGITQSFMKPEDADKAGSLFTTGDPECDFCHDLMILRAGKLDPLSSEMSRRGVGHVFCFVPKDEVKPDWKLKWFNCRDFRFILAFDGDALMLKEMWNRHKLQK